MPFGPAELKNPYSEMRLFGRKRNLVNDDIYKKYESLKDFGLL